MYVVVQRPLADGEAVGVRGDDVVQRLAVPHPPGKQGRQLPPLLLGDGCALSARRKGALVGLLCVGRDVEPLVEHAGPLLAAAVAHVGGLVEAGAGQLHELVADGVAFRAGAAFRPAHGMDALCAQVFPVALASVDAAVRDTPLRALVAGDAAGQDLPHDGASRLLQGSGDCAEPPVRTQAVPCLGTVRQGQM